MANLAEQVAALAAERDAHRLDAVRAASAHLDTLGKLAAAESRLASARVEGARKCAGALFGFAAHLTAMPTEYRVGAMHDASRMVEELSAWAKRMGVSLDSPEYPAPAAPAGEQTQHVGGKAQRGDWYTCGKCREDGMHFDGCALGECEAVCVRPAPTPEPEECARTPLRVIAGWESTDKDADGDDRVWYIAMCEDGSVWARQTFLTNDQPWQRQAPSIVALGSRPTQTAEG